MFSDFQKQITYYGILDDVVDRYPWPNPVDLKSIRSQLITSQIYGKTILINDGYLIANPLLVDDIKNINTSLIGTLLTSGTARLFSRNENADLAAGFERTAERVLNHRKIVENPAVWTPMREQLDYLSGEVRHKAITWPRDKNMGHLFYLLMKRIAGMTTEQRRQVMPAKYDRDFDAIFRQFDDNLDKATYDAARTYWEEYCWRHFAGHDIDPHALGAIRIPQERLKKYPAYNDVRAMMNIANEAYHLAYSAGASHTIRTSNQLGDYNMGVATALITSFPDLAGSQTTPEAGTDEATMVAMNQLIISMPGHVEFARDFTCVRSIRTEYTVAATGKAYRKALQDFANGAITFDEAHKVRNAYVAELSNLMAPHLRVAGSLVGTKNLSDLMLNVFTDALKFAPVAGWLLSLGVDHFRTKIIERMMVARIATAFGEEGITATQNANQIPLARKYGFYTGPLETAGVQKLVDQVDAHPAMKHASTKAP